MALAVVYNNFLKTAGGGERSSLDYAAALDQLGYQVVVAVDHPVRISLAEACSPFGIRLSDRATLTEFNGIGDLQHFIQVKDVEVFVNHTYCSWIRNYAKVGIYSVMFAGVIGPTENANLATYARIFCNSDFTEQYLKARWDSQLNVSVLVPPISETHLESARNLKFENKQRLILNIGRFNVFGHNKHQLKAVEAFVRAVDSKVFDGSWQLRVIGNAAQNPETVDYIAKCRKLAVGYNIEIIEDASVSYLQQSYQEASFLWQFTGFGLEFGIDGWLCEHLGLVALDGFCYGVMPIAYQRGGAAMLIRSGVDGFVFEDQKELDELNKLCSKFVTTERHKQAYTKLRQKSEQFSFENFKAKLGQHIRECLSDK